MPKEYSKGSDSCKDSFSFPIGSTGGIQHDDGSPWMHDILEDMNKTDHQGWFYFIRVMKADRLTICNMTTM